MLKNTIFRFLYLGLLFLQFDVWAQGFELAWAKSYGNHYTGVATCMGMDGSGNVYIGSEYFLTLDHDLGPGTTNYTAAGQRDFSLSKFDNDGNFVWAISFGSADQEFT